MNTVDKEFSAQVDEMLSKIYSKAGKANLLSSRYGVPDTNGMTETQLADLVDHVEQTLRTML